MSMPLSVDMLFTGCPASADKFLTGISSVVLLRHADRLILFDTGPYAYRPILQGRLKRLGIEPGQIDTVVLSHVHWDTAANADLFPNASVVIHERELSYANSPERHDASTPAYCGRALQKLRLAPFSGEPDIADGLKLVELPGHTPGSIGLLAGDALFAGDAIPSARHVIAGNADGHDAVAACKSLKRAAAMASIIYPGHDRPFRVRPAIEYLDDYALRIRFFTDPAGCDEEIRVGSFAARSFASWPND